MGDLELVMQLLNSEMKTRGLNATPLNETIAKILDKVNGGTVKSVQRGVHSGSTGNINITISSVDPDKCHVTIYPYVQGTYSGNSSRSSATGVFPRVLGLTETVLQLTASTTPIENSSFSTAAAALSWEIVEYY